MPKLQAPDSGVTVRMYRPGHGDCFVLAFPRDGGDPVYVMIDCGYKPGSQEFIHKKTIDAIVDHLGESTGQHLDLAILTHEHQDHLNGIWKKTDPYFDDFQIDEAWLAWTERPQGADDLADELRRRHRDQLLSLVAARQKLARAVGTNDPAIRRVDSLLSLEFGGEDDAFSAAAMRAAASDPTRSQNKQGLKLVKDKAAEHRGVSYFDPGDGPIVVPGTAGVRAYVFGPPRSADLIADEDPHDGEGFPMGISFGAAVGANGPAGGTPFAPRYGIPSAAAMKKKDSFFRKFYGKKTEGENDEDKIEVPGNAEWRRIDAEWLYSAESLALKLNAGINNTSLVLAFELPATKKVLFFAADAQRGNWFSWKECEWTDGERTITVRDLLARTVLYKVGHHGSHNATLAGALNDVHANLSWMGTGAAANEFTAMITAVNDWAMTKNDPPWRHPLPSIAKALADKAHGRVFQTDVDKPKKPRSVPAGEWAAFMNRCKFEELYFDYTIPDA